MMRSLAALALAAAAVQAARPVLPADTVATESLSDVQAARDGSFLLYTAARSELAANKNRTRAMRLDLGAGGANPRELTGLPEGAGTLRLSPDGTRVAFFASSGGTRGLWVANLIDGKSRRVCDAEASNAYLSHAGNALAWSPDGRQLAFVATIDPKPAARDPLVITRILYKSRTAFSDDRRMHVLVVSADGGAAARVLTPGPFDEHSIDWGGDGGEIVFLSNRGKDPDARLNYDLFAVRVADEHVRRITETAGVEMSPRVSPNGQWIAYTATKRRLTTIDSVAEDAHVWIAPFGGGAARELNGTQDRRSLNPQWAPDGTGVLFTALSEGRALVYRTPAPGGGSAEAVWKSDVQISSFAPLPGGDIAAVVSTPASPGELLRLGRGAPQTLTSHNAAVADEWTLTRPERMTLRSFDGTAVEGWLYLPPHAAGTRVPMILSIHGGPHGMHGYGFNAIHQAYASRGYATLAVNPRGSAGYGQKFADGCVNDWGGGDYRDLMAAVDHVLRTRREIDPARLGVTGGSYGGFMTNWVVTQTQRFHGAVAVASLSNLISFYATSLYQDLVHAEFNGFPWDGRNFDVLWRWSPLKHIKQVTTPVLLLHGENDNDVHVTQAEEMYTALRQRGVESVLVRYPREGHGFTEPKHRVDAIERTLDWMDRFVKQEGK